jgi:lipoprotein NlpI
MKFNNMNRIAGAAGFDCTGFGRTGFGRTGLFRNVFAILAIGLAIATGAAMVSGAAWAGPLDDARAADAAAEEGDFERALDLYQRALDTGELTQNNTAAVHFNRGGVFMQLGEFENAIQDFTQTVLIKPEHKSAYLTRGVALRAVGRSEQALTDLTKALELRSDSEQEMYNLRGLAYNDIGDYPNAIEDFTTALTFNPAWAYATRNRGRSRYYMGQYAEAAVDFEAAYDLERDPWMAIWSFVALSRSNQESAAENILTREMRRLREDAWPRPIVEMLAGNMPPSEVLELTRDPSDPELSAGRATEAMYYIGEKLLLEGDSKQAAAFFERAIDLGVTNFVEYDAARIALERIGR